ncbi:MAG TPA: regulatory protein RecX [Acidobacteriota bacterium]|nr:regulatory protein RecX [Acidobacteriota bacterium]
MKTQIRIDKIRVTVGKYRIKISTLDEPLTFTREIVEKYGLKEGTVITVPQLEQLKSEAEWSACDCEVARLLALREHSVGEIKVKLTRKRFDRELIERIVERYRRKGLLDDAHFAWTVARSVLERRPAGRSYLVAYLRRKRIERVLAERTVDMMLAGRDDADLAAEALRRRWSHFSQFDLETARRKAYNYLSRRGIGYEASKAAFELLCKAQEEGSDD